MRAGFYQDWPVFGEVDNNVSRALRIISGVDADIVVLPELFNTGYQFINREEALGLAEEIPSGKTCEAMILLAQTKSMFLVFGLVEKDRDHIYNSAVIAGPKGFVGVYRKTHLFFEEKAVFDPGNTGFQVFNLGKARIGVMICFDWWFPESARTLALLGADIICHPANLVLPNCQQVMLARSLENGVFSITSNRVGVEARGGKTALTFTGESQIIDNKGLLITKMGNNEKGIMIADIDPVLARDKSITEYNDRFKDRRPEFYTPLSRQS